MTCMRRWIVFLTALLLGVALDLGTKAWAFSQLQSLGVSSKVNDWFSFSRAHNEGAAFSLFEGQQSFFMIVSLAAFVAVPYFVHVARERVVPTAIVLGLILAGVMGNFWEKWPPLPRRTKNRPVCTSATRGPI